MNPPIIDIGIIAMFFAGISVGMIFGLLLAKSIVDEVMRGVSNEITKRIE